MAEIKTIQVNGTTLAYQEFGQGDKYLLSMQNFFLTDCHASLLGQPPYDYHVFLVYMRGYGQSEHIFDPEPKDYVSIWGQDLIAFAEKWELRSSTITGVLMETGPAGIQHFTDRKMIRALCVAMVSYSL